MKLFWKILLSVLATLFILITGVLVFQDALVAYTLRRVIATQSQQKVTLDLQGISLDFLSGKILIEKPTLHFSELYLGEDKNIKFTSFSTQMVEVDSLDLHMLIFDRNILAHKFLLDKPVFELVEQGSQTKSSFQPEKLIDLLKADTALFGPLHLKVDEIIINYGSILLSENANPGMDPGTVDFTFIFKDFNSHPPDSIRLEERFLFSSEFRLILKDLNKKLASGYILNIDSAGYSSREQDLIVEGASLRPDTLSLDENSVAIQVGRFGLNDIQLEEISGLENLNLRSVILEDALLINYVNVTGKSSQDTTDASSKLDQLTRLVSGIALDSVSVNKLEYIHIQNLQDTSIHAHNVNFLLTEILVDSGAYADLMRNIEYREIRLNTGRLKLEEVIPDMVVRYDGLDYNNIDKLLDIKGIYVVDSGGEGNREALRMVMDELRVRGVSFADFRQGRPQKLNVSFLRPNGDILLDRFLGSGKEKGEGKGDLLLSQYIDLERLDMVNGDFRLKKTGEADLDVRGLDVALDGLDLALLEKDSLSFRKLEFGYRTIRGYLAKERLNFVTGEMRYDKPGFILKDIEVESFREGAGGKFRAGSLALTGFDMERLIYRKELATGNLYLVGPVFTTTIEDNSESNETEGWKAFNEILLPITVQTDSVAIIQGFLDGELLSRDKEVSVRSGFELLLGGFSVRKDEPLNKLLEALKWRISLDGVVLNAMGHEVMLEELVTDRYTGSFDAKNIEVGGQELTARRNFRVKKFDLPYLGLTGVDYDLLLQQDSLSISSLFVDGPRVELEFKQQPSDTTSLNKPEKIDLKEFIPFSYDTARIDNLFVSVEVKGDTSLMNFSVDSMNFGHHFSGDEEANLIDNLEFNVHSLTFRDSLKGTFLKVSNGRIDREERSFRIDRVAGKGARVDAGGDHREKPQMEYNARDIRFVNIYLDESLPSGLHIDKLSFDNLNLDVVQTPRDTNETSKNNLRINLDIMNRFSRVMTRLSLDTTQIKGINVTVHSFDQQQKESFSIDSVALIVENINLDTSMIGQEDPLVIKKLTVDLKGRSRITGDSLYEIQTGRLHYDFASKTIILDSFAMNPRYGEEEFFRRAEFQTDRAILFSSKVEVRNLNIEELLNEDLMHCGTINIYDLNADLFRDKRYPIKPGTYKPMPRELLMGLNSNIAIDTLNIIGAYLKYSERDAKANRPGTIFLDNINGSVFDITNRLNGERKNMKLDLHGRIMGEAKMDATVYFPLYPDSTAYWLSVKSEKMDLTMLNPVTENLLGIGILRGKGSVDAELISGTDSLAKGSLIFRYKKLKLAMYSRKKEQLNRGFVSPLINFLINDLVIKSNNPKFARKPRVGQVYFVRDTQKGVVNYLWKSVLSGLTSTLGFNNKDQRIELKQKRKKR